MTFAEHMKEWGRKAGEVDLLSRQLKKKFGELPEWALDRLQQAESTQLEAWAERLLEIDNLDELFA